MSQWLGPRPPSNVDLKELHPEKVLLALKTSLGIISEPHQCCEEKEGEEEEEEKKTANMLDI